jgi:hypothetical protein
MILLYHLESSGYQCQDGIKHPQHHFSFLGDTQMLLHILQGVKVSVKRKTQQSEAFAFKPLKLLFL